MNAVKQMKRARANYQNSMLLTVSMTVCL